jgi:hypothetical protein
MNAKDVTEKTERKIPVSDGTASARGRFGAGPWLLSDGAVYIGLLKGRSTSASLGMYVTSLENKLCEKCQGAIFFSAMLALLDSVSYRGIK